MFRQNTPYAWTHEKWQIYIRDMLLELFPDVDPFGLAYSVMRDGQPLKAHGEGACRKGTNGRRIVLLHAVLDNENSGGDTP